MSVAEAEARRHMLGRLDRQFTWTRAEVPFYPSEPSAHVLPHVYLTTHSLELPLKPFADSRGMEAEDLLSQRAWRIQATSDQPADAWNGEEHGDSHAITG